MPVSRNVKNVKVTSAGKVLAFFHRVLARCDTVHDFTKARAIAAMRPPFSVDDIYACLDSLEGLNASGLKAEFKQLAGDDPTTLRGFEAILHNAAPRFLFLRSYALGGDSKRVGYEPSVVQFFEHFLGRYGLLDEFYLTTSERILRTCYVDYTGGETRCTALPPGKVCVMNLGHVAKEDVGREASGVFCGAEALGALQSDLCEFFGESGGGGGGVNFLVDASCVRHELFHNPPAGLRVIHTAASEWDSAHKYSNGDALDAPPLHLTREDSCGVLNAIDSLYVSLNPRGCAVNCDPGADACRTVDMSLLPREVGSIISCAQGSADASARYRKAVEQLDAAFDPENPLDRLPWLFDIKRSGDGGQVMHAMTLIETSGKFVFVTNDHLAFLKARMCGVPVVFTKRNGRTGAMMLVCIRQGPVDQEAYDELLLEALEEESAALAVWDAPALQKVKSAYESVIDAFAQLGDLIKRRFFKDDDTFARAVYAALTQGVGGPTFDDLSQQQLLDLDAVANRVQVYVFDFLACYVDLVARLAMSDSLTGAFRDLEREFATLKVRERGHRLAELRSKGYGPEAYAWCLDEGQVQEVLDKLAQIKLAIDNTTDDARLLDVLTRHFFLEDSAVTQQALNFRPLHGYDDIWQFVRSKFATLSLGGITAARDGNLFESSWRAFVASREKALRSAATVRDAHAMDIVRQQLDEAYALDSLYRESVLEDAEHNFDFKFDVPAVVEQSGGSGADASLEAVSKKELLRLEDALYFQILEDMPRATPAYLQQEQAMIASLKETFPGALLPHFREEFVQPQASIDPTVHPIDDPRFEIEGGGKDKDPAALLQAVANDNAEVVLQIGIIAMSFAFLNGILVKNNDPKQPKNLALNILLNSGLTIALLLVDLQENVKLCVFVLYLAAVGYMVSKFM